MIRKRTVVVRVTLEMVVTKPESWDDDAIEFHYNESSSCKNNLVTDINALRDRLGEHGCLCSLGHVEFVREATEEDEDTQRVWAQRERRPKP